MYFSISAYPSINKMTKADQRQIVVKAAREFDKSSRIRFWIAAFVLFVLPVVFARSSFAPNWLTAQPWLVAIFGGLGFYAFLLWDINGPTMRAVERYMAKGSIA